MLFAPAKPTRTKPKSVQQTQEQQSRRGSRRSNEAAAAAAAAASAFTTFGGDATTITSTAGLLAGGSALALSSECGVSESRIGGSFALERISRSCKHANAAKR